MRKLVFVILASLSSLSLIGQTEKKNETTESCEEATKKYSHLLTKYSIDQKQGILQIIELWEASCGENEPIQRVKILLDIYENNFTDSSYSGYFGAYIFDYFDRVDAAYEENHKETYDNNKAFFNYVPLRSTFDDWTWNIAKKLKEQQEYGSSAYLMTLLYTEDIKAFDDALKNSAYKDSYIKNTLDDVVYTSTSDDVNFVLNAGVWMPVGDLRWRFSLSPMIGLAANIPVTKKYSVEFGAQFTFWTNNKEIEVFIEDSLHSIDSKYGGTYGIWIHRKHSFDNDFFIDITGGLAYTNMGTGIEKLDTEDDETSYYHIGTIDLSLGFNIRRKINFKRHDVGLNFSYHFRPYNIDKRLETKLGNHSYSLSLFYWF